MVHALEDKEGVDNNLRLRVIVAITKVIQHAGLPQFSGVSEDFT